MNLEIKHLRLIVAITEEKSVTKAGERLLLTQSALSHQLREIENRLGTDLFLRLKRKMILTPAGEILLESARKILADLENTENVLKNIADSRQGLIRISTECYTCYHWLPALLQKFNRDHPDVDVEIVVDATRKPILALIEGKLDLAVTSQSDVERNIIDYNVLFEDEMVVIMHPDHPLTNRKFIKPKDFNDEHLIIYGNLDNNTVYTQVLAPAGVKLRRTSDVQLTEAIIEMVKADLGIGILARWAIPSQLGPEVLVSRPLTRAGYKRRWFAATLKRKTVPNYLTEFIELLSNSGQPEYLEAVVFDQRDLS